MKKSAFKRRNFIKSLGFGVAASSLGSCSSSESGLSIHTRQPVQKYETDVLVAGGGPAGIGAALAAARQGARTLLIENQGFLGGIGVFGLGMTINQVRPANRPRGAIHELVVKNLQNYGTDLSYWFEDHALVCNVEYLKVALLDALEEVGAKYLVHTRAVDAAVNGNRITHVTVATKQGLVDIPAKAFVDCTGDADLAYFAGAETLKAENELSPMTLLLNFTNIDPSQEKLRGYAQTIKDAASKAREKYPLIPESWGMHRFPVSTAVYTNHSGTKTHGIFDGTDPEQLTAAEALSRRQALQMTHTMREFGGEELKNIELSRAAPQVGVRETRRVKGQYVLTEDDAKIGRTFEDVVAWRSGHLDIGFVRLERMKIHDVPYRAIIPEKLDGLLMAGRCISASHVAASAGKSMGNCIATGHAAGLAAAMCARKGTMPRELKVEELQNALRADEVDLTMGGTVQDWLDL